MKIKAAGDLLTSREGALSRARSLRSRACLFSKRKMSVKAEHSSLRKRLRISFSVQAIRSYQSMNLYGPLYEQPVG